MVYMHTVHRATSSRNRTHKLSFFMNSHCIRSHIILQDNWPEHMNYHHCEQTLQMNSLTWKKSFDRPPMILLISFCHSCHSCYSCPQTWILVVTDYGSITSDICIEIWHKFHLELHWSQNECNNRNDAIYIALKTILYR